jgi:hypothetical protein
MVTIALSIIGGTTEFGVLGIVLGPLIISLRLAVLQAPRRIAVGGRDPLPRKPTYRSWILRLRKTYESSGPDDSAHLCRRHMRETATQGQPCLSLLSAIE